MHWKTLYADLIAQLEMLGPEPNRMQLLECVQRWLRRFVGQWSPELRRRWGLDEYATMDLSGFPIDEAFLVPIEEVGRLRAVPPGSMDTFAMFLRDLFWSGITVESEIACPRCGNANLRILEDPRSAEVVLACDLCGWAQTPNGETWSGEDRLRPAPTPLVARWRSGRWRVNNGAQS